MNKYHILLDTKNQLFTAVDNKDSNKFGNGKTIQEAISNLKKLKESA